MKKIYVASSWRNQYLDTVVTLLNAVGHRVYDFRNPPEKSGFSWREIEPGWVGWTTDEYIQALKHPIAQRGFLSDFNAMHWADVCLLVLPCGRSAHIEAGWFAGASKQLVVYIPAPERIEPELMYLVGGFCVHSSIQGVLDAIEPR